MLLGEVIGASGGVAGADATAGAAGDDRAVNGGVGGEAGDAGAGGVAGAPPDECPMEGGAPGLMENGVYNDGPLPAPWQTGFEDGFCGYRLDAGFCYPGTQTAYRLVRSPVRSGAFAAAFEIGVNGTDQTRCVREGQLPTEAYYGAWFYLPESASDPNNWNLVHFQGGEPGGTLRGLWDVSLGELPSGELAAYVAGDGLAGGAPWQTYEQERPVAIPIGRWFQLEFYLKRAANSTGELALFQDGEELIRLTGIATDDTDWGQWYVGNLAAGLNPSRFTVYVDDVTVRLGP